MRRAPNSTAASAARRWAANQCSRASEADRAYRPVSAARLWLAWISARAIAAIPGGNGSSPASGRTNARWLLPRVDPPRPRRGRCARDRRTPPPPGPGGGSRAPRWPGTGRRPLPAGRAPAWPGRPTPSAWRTGTKSARQSRMNSAQQKQPVRNARGRGRRSGRTAAAHQRRQRRYPQDGAAPGQVCSGPPAGHQPVTARRTSARHIRLQPAARSKWANGTGADCTDAVEGVSCWTD